MTHISYTMIYIYIYIGGEEHFKEKAREAAMKPCCPQWRAVRCTKSFEAFSIVFKLFSDSFEVFNHSENHFLWQVQVKCGFTPSESLAYGKRPSAACKPMYTLPRPYSVFDFYYSTGCAQAQLPRPKTVSQTLRCPALYLDF